MCNCVIKTLSSYFHRKTLSSYFHRGKGAHAFPSWNRCKGKDDL